MSGPPVLDMVAFAAWFALLEMIVVVPLACLARRLVLR